MANSSHDSGGVAAPPSEMLEEGPRTGEAFGPQTAIWIDADSVDELYSRPIVESRDSQSEPVSHTRIAGRFEGTDTRFVILLPSPSKWAGRFFQCGYPLMSEIPDTTHAEFALTRGIAVVQATGAAGYRHDAATAKFARALLAEHLGVEGTGIAGYYWGGSGGSLQMVGALENTSGVWQGIVPFVQAIPSSVVNNMAALAFGGLVFGDRMEQLRDTIRPGSAKLPEDVLDETQCAVLRELTEYGIPLGSWEGLDCDMIVRVLWMLSGGARAMDPTYMDDFWTGEGYLGSESSDLGELFRAHRRQATGTVIAVNDAEGETAASIVLDVDRSFFLQPGVEIELIERDGSRTPLRGQPMQDGVFALDVPMAGLATGATVVLDNSWILALQAYFRYQAPRSEGFDGWRQYYRDGELQQPRRPVDVAEVMATGTSGGAAFSGDIHAKMIIIQNMLDAGALPWNALWYERRVRAANPDADYRIWFTDNAEHNNGPVSPEQQLRIIQYDGIFYQALLDIAAWAESGVEPAPTTAHTVKGAVVDTARRASRGGIQPVVRLAIEGSSSVTARVGEGVEVTVTADVPEGTGQIVRLHWNLQGDDNWAVDESFEIAASVTSKRVVRFEAPGVYFPVVRATAQRDGDRAERWTLIHNLDRLRVTVLAAD
ncbi:hypothetical protein ACIPY5_15155 [Microbacterium sp. NPDC089698]|uniref:hypothetical protein n=1 Tax=Microbacterium sp. NPDC089698 TaxID=3364200 RepID=UPI0038229D94